MRTPWSVVSDVHDDAPLKLEWFRITHASVGDESIIPRQRFPCPHDVGGRQGIADRQDRFGSAIDANDASLQRAKRAVKIEFAACEHPTGLGRVAGLAVVTVKSLSSYKLCRRGGAARPRSVGGGGSRAGKADNYDNHKPSPACGRVDCGCHADDGGSSTRAGRCQSGRAVLASSCSSADHRARSEHREDHTDKTLRRAESGWLRMHTSLTSSGAPILAPMKATNGGARDYAKSTSQGAVHGAATG